MPSRRRRLSTPASTSRDEDAYEHRQIPATRERVPEAEVLTFPGGHLTTSEHPDLLAAAIRDIARRHGVATPAAASR
jgi:pimeloyl-ACP methyl ester carboxylesterase